MGCRLVPKSVTLNDLEQRTYGRYFALFYLIRPLWVPITSKWLKVGHTVCDKNVVQEI